MTSITLKIKLYLLIYFQKLKSDGIYVIEDSSRYLSALHLNPDNLTFGQKKYFNQ